MSEVLHMGEALDWLTWNLPTLKEMETYSINSHLDLMAATSVTVYQDEDGKKHRYELSNGGCSVYLDV